MRNKSKKEKLALKKLEQKILRDLKKFKNDWQRFLLIKNKHVFLRKIAKDIKKLNDDANLAENISPIEPTGNLIHHLLNTPWSTPFTGDKTLLEAALLFDYQNPRYSDLYYLLEHFSHYSSHLNNEFLTIFGSLYNIIEQEQ